MCFERNGMAFKLTPQRLAIFRYMKGNTDHPSAEKIYSHVRKDFPSMSMATVYNTLELLLGRNELRELTIDSTRKRYDPNLEEHHHMICTRCSTIVDIWADFPLDIPPDERQGFALSGNCVQFYGLCPECSAKGGE